MLRRRTRASSDDAPAPKPESFDSIIGEKAEVVGDLAFAGRIRVAGRVTGNVLAPEQAGSTLLVGERGEVEGHVIVPHVIVKGRVRGTSAAKRRLELTENARVDGDVHYGQISMALGAAVNGSLIFEQDARSAGSARSTAPLRSARRVGARR